MEVELARVPRELAAEMQGQSWSLHYMPQVGLGLCCALQPASGKDRDSFAAHDAGAFWRLGERHAAGAASACIAMCKPGMPQVGFVVRLEGGHLSAALQDSLPDYTFAFEEAASDGQEPGFFYTCRRTALLNEEYGDLLSIIHDYEVR